MSLRVAQCLASGKLLIHINWTNESESLDIILPKPLILQIRTLRPDMTWWRLVAENDHIPSLWTPRPSPFPHLSWRVSHPWTMMTLPRRHPAPFAHLPNSGQNLSSLFCSRADCVEGLGEHWTGRVIRFLDLLWPLAGHHPSLRTKATRQISCALLLAQHTVSSWVWVPYSLQTAPLLGKTEAPLLEDATPTRTMSLLDHLVLNPVT